MDTGIWILLLISFVTAIVIIGYTAKKQDNWDIRSKEKDFNSQNDPRPSEKPIVLSVIFLFLMVIIVAIARFSAK